ncbi:MAG: hypothetical protein M1334_04460 [Patescibacteria group bacterium]|nr:hypothetical protein [Patescibacteria group bacterium]
MNQTITAFLGADAQDDKKVVELLEGLKKKGVAVKYIKDAGILADRLDFPFIETERGDRFFGIDSINKFVQQQIQ